MPILMEAEPTEIVADGMTVFESHDAMDAEQIRRLERLAFQYGQYSDSYLITEPNRSYLWSSCGEGVVGFARQGKFLAITGGLITADRNKARFLREIVDFAKRTNRTLIFYHVDDRDVPLFEDAGFQVTRFGVEARIALSGHSWSGKAFKWVRRQFNFVKRHGIAFEEWAADDVAPDEWERRLGELHEVSAEHISEKHFRGEIPFFEGRLLNDHLYRRRCFVARAEEGRGRVEGFVLCTPIENGRQWAIEMYRQRRDAVRGVIPYMMHQTIERLRDEGCDGVSMCPVPAIGCEQKRPGDSWVARKSLTL